MPRKRHGAEEIVTKLRQVDVLSSQGKSVAEAIRSIGVTEVTYYRWRSEYGGLKGDQVKRLKELETENARLRRAVSDLTLVQTLGSDGLRYRHRLGAGVSDWAHLTAINAPNMVDTCGSGDWCTAGLLNKVAVRGQSGLQDSTSDSIYQVLRYGQALAAWNCGFEGARGGMYAVDSRAFAKQIVSLLEGRPRLSVIAVKALSDASVACPACPPEKNGAEDPGPHSVRRSTRKVAAA